MIRRLPFGLILLMAGCQLISSIPSGSLPMAQRVERSKALVERRKTEAESFSLNEKAVLLEDRIRKEFLLEPYALLAKYLTDREKQGFLSHTSYLLAALSFKCATLKIESDDALVHRMIDSLAALDAANGFDGYIPESAKVGNGGLVVTQNETHTNAYTMLLFSYLSACQHGDAKSKKAIRDHLSVIADHFLKYELVLHDETGAPVPHSNIKPTPFQFSRSRILDGLVLVETMIALLDGTDHSDIVEQLKEQRKKMIQAGYLKQIQSLHFSFFNIIVVPTHSTDWLNFMRLWVLTEVSDRAAYRRALEKLFRSQRVERNPLFIIVYLSRISQSTFDREDLKRDMHDYLRSFPLSLDNSEVINSRDRAVAQKMFPPIVKHSWILEAKVPLEVYRRPLTHNEWKRNPFRLDGNHSFRRKVMFSGTEFLMAYWMGRYYGLIDEDD